MSTSSAESLPAPSAGHAQLEVCDLAAYQPGTAIRSASVAAGHLRYRILTFPVGVNQAMGNKYLSVFIEVDPEGLIEQWSFEKVRYSITLVNRRDASLNHTREDVCTFNKSCTDRGWHDFFKISQIAKGDNGWLGHGNSILLYGNAEVDMSRDSWLRMSTCQHCLALNISSLLSSGWHADVKLSVGDHEVDAHSVILAARSPVFKQMLDSGMKESSTHRVSITDMDPGVLNLFINFMYSGTVDDLSCAGEATICALMHAGSKYEVPSLVEFCAEKVKEFVSVDNSVDWLLVAEQFNVERLRDFCAKFIGTHLSQVQTTPGWERLMQDKQMVFDLAPLLFRKISPPVKRPRLDEPR